VGKGSFPDALRHANTALVGPQRKSGVLFGGRSGLERMRSVEVALVRTPRGSRKQGAQITSAEQSNAEMALSANKAAAMEGVQWVRRPSLQRMCPISSQAERRDVLGFWGAFARDVQKTRRSTSSITDGVSDAVVVQALEVERLFERQLPSGIAGLRLQPVILRCLDLNVRHWNWAV
jgi:hypothetical protein